MTGTSTAAAWVFSAILMAIATMLISASIETIETAAIYEEIAK